MEELNLEPCPFCAGRARMVMLAPSIEGGFWTSYVFCRKCNASTGQRMADTRDGAMCGSEKRWNERA